MAQIKFSKKRYIMVVSLAAVIWYLAYSSLVNFSQYVTYSVLGILPDTRLGDSVEFFIYDTFKILLLLLLMVYTIGFIRAAISVEKIRGFLLGKKNILGYFFGALFGAVTPFCSCSSIPLFIGFTTARIPLGITMAFLITSPLINEVAVVILWGLLGWKFTVIYVCLGMTSGIIGGLIMDKIRAERWLRDFLKQHYNQAAVGIENQKITWQDRHNFAFHETRDIFKRVWIWVIVGVGVGALLHGYVPQSFVTDNLGYGQWWSVPAAVIIGMPLYTNVTGIIPVMESLLIKGLPVGTTLALCMSTVTVSVPEIIMLKQVMKWQLLVLFIGVMLLIFVTVGWVFNFLAPYIF